ncbi:proline-rich transmembrane protein 1 [Oryzias latipes]|uniref:proline-rich transmembrane protein 1 n=1 Tax=Oryzias latipes TaxID=8090 RepID=UPI0005CC0511|nr:proline-rich transmembrane protein 1 [Oryzias latipes]
MDPNHQHQIPSAPPQDLNEDKSFPSNYPAPPPYQTLQFPGPSQPGMGFPQPQQGFGSPPPFPVATYEQQPYPPGFQYPAHPGAFSVPPTVVLTRAPLQDPVNNYMCYSIFTTIFCCLPFGIAALIHSNAASRANQMGDRAGAEKNARLARNLNHTAVGLGILVYIIFVAVMVFVLLY